MAQNYCPLEEEVADLSYLLPADFRRRVYVLYGLAGSGKTQLATYFARKHKLLGVFTSVIWVNATSSEELWTSLGNHVHDLYQDYTCVPFNKATRATVVLNWLARSKRWLLVLDGVGQDTDDVVGAHQVMKCISETHGSVLITTRLAHLQKLGRSRMLHGVDIDRGYRVFQAWYGLDLVYTEDDVRALVRYFFGHPLAIAEAAITLRNVDWSIKKYLQLFERSQASQKRVSFLTIYPQGTLRNVWFSTINTIWRKNLNAFHLLLLWTCLDSYDLWFGLLSTAQDLQHQPNWLRELSDETQFKQAIALLREYCLVDTLPLSGYSLHPAFHKWLSCTHLNSEIQQLAVNIVGAAVPESVTPGFWRIERRILRHAEICFKWIVAGVFLNPGIATLHSIVYLGDLYLDQDRLAEAETLYSYVVQGHCRTNSPWKVQILRRLAGVCARRDRADDSELLLKQALQACEEFCSLHENEAALDVVADLARLYLEIGRLEESFETYTQALQGKEALLGDAHLSTLDTVNGFGTLFMARHDLEAARRFYLRALKGQEIALGSSHIFTLNTLNSLGIVYALQGQTKEAETLCRIALAGYTVHLGPEHHMTVNIIHNIATFLKDQGLSDAAERTLEAT